MFRKPLILSIILRPDQPAQSDPDSPRLKGSAGTAGSDTLFEKRASRLGWEAHFPDTPIFVVSGTRFQMAFPPVVRASFLKKYASRLGREGHLR